jgi:hypothetical protein
MMPSGENQNLEATQPTSIISTRTTAAIGTWNVQTMYETGKAAQVAAEMKSYKLTILYYMLIHNQCAPIFPSCGYIMKTIICTSSRLCLELTSFVISYYTASPLPHIIIAHHTSWGLGHQPQISPESLVLSHSL